MRTAISCKQTGNIVVDLTKVDNNIFITNPATGEVTIDIANLFSNIFEKDK